MGADLRRIFVLVFAFTIGWSAAAEENYKEDGNYQLWPTVDRITVETDEFDQVTRISLDLQLKSTWGKKLFVIVSTVQGAPTATLMIGHHPKEWDWLEICGKKSKAQWLFGDEERILWPAGALDTSVAKYFVTEWYHFREIPRANLERLARTSNVKGRVCSTDSGTFTFEEKNQKSLRTFLDETWEVTETDSKAR